MEINKGRKVDLNFWKGKKVFITGHTGFKGSWLSLWLQSMGVIIKGYSLEAPTTPALFNVAKVQEGMETEVGDIRNLEAIKKSMKEFNPDILIHMAAQPLVRLSYYDPVETYSTNVMGTVNVLEAARSCKNLKAIVSVTTDKCYENKEWFWGYRENEPMGGYDPYSNSKGCAELVSSAYRNSFFREENSANLATARAGNVIGGGDWAKDRLIPDILNALQQKQPVIIRNPLAVRPWQHVLEPLSGYLMLAESLYKETGYDEAWNFGPRDNDCKPVGDIINKMTQQWGNGVEWRQDTSHNPHEAHLLKLDCSKAHLRLNWEPRWNVDQTLEKIISWHKTWLDKKDMKDYCLKEIDEYKLSIGN